ncbi:hypothetical protein [Methanolacinia petrolearia]|uniref:hypothetical protein n=1 Tax=Methanolacinia petrolearia TaxID=54120 RepID=UPI003BA8F09A
MEDYLRARPLGRGRPTAFGRWCLGSPEKDLRQQRAKKFVEIWVWDLKDPNSDFYSKSTKITDEYRMSEDLISEAPVKKIVWEKQIPLFSNTVVIKQLANVIIIPAFF